MAVQFGHASTKSYENSIYYGPFLYSKHKTTATCLPMCRTLFSKLTLHCYWKFVPDCPASCRAFCYFWWHLMANV